MLKNEIKQYIKNYSNKISVENEGQFQQLALRVFKRQAIENETYAAYLKLLGKDIEAISNLCEIPFLPVSFFKEYEIKTGEWQEKTIFTSSTTSGQTPSKHFVRDTKWYHQLVKSGIEELMPISPPYTLIALLPSYLERSGSSLVEMAKYWMKISGQPQEYFFINNFEELSNRIKKLFEVSQRIVLLGVTYALLDFSKQHGELPADSIVIETGGMKGQRKEMTKNEVHAILKKNFKLEDIWSEYGMCELFSQAFGKGSRMTPAPTLKAIGRELNDPFKTGITGRTVGLNFIDLGNVDTLSFIETADQGIVYPDGTFEIIGRIDGSETRGCNLMYGH
jgi:hypothetical protein